MVVQVTGTNWPQPAYTLLVTGLCRFKLDAVLQETPYLVARVTQLESIPGEGAGKASLVDLRGQVLYSVTSWLSCGTFTTCLGGSHCSVSSVILSRTPIGHKIWSLKTGGLW